MAKQHDIVSFQIVGVSERRAGAIVRPFGPAWPKLGDAVKSISRLEVQHGGLWEFRAVGIRSGESVGDAIARTPIPAAISPEPWKLYAVEARQILGPAVYPVRWWPAWGRTPREALEDFEWRYKSKGKLAPGDVVELSTEQEAALEQAGPNDFREALEAYALENRANRTEAAAL